MKYQDDWKRPLTEDEVFERMVRVGTWVECPECGQPYVKHPMETRVLSYDGHPYLNRLCDGRLGKL